MPGTVEFKVEQAPATVVLITGADGQQYEMRAAIMVQAVVDTGQVNPLDGLPVFNVVSQVLAQLQKRGTE
jgi:hypothetical protein